MAVGRRRRYLVVGIVVVAALAALAAFYSANAAAKAMTVAEACAPGAAGQRVEVSGEVADAAVDADGVLVFSLVDPDDPSTALRVEYDGGAQATFGDGVSAVCTGTVGEDGSLRCRELVTKCPSKYGNATGAVGVAQLLGYGEAVMGKTVRVAGALAPGTLAAAGADPRFSLADADDPAARLPVRYGGALPDGIADGASLVLQGSLAADGSFEATEVASEG